MLKIKREILDAIISHAKKELPNEACGYLAEQQGLICNHYEMTNTDKAADHYSMAPEEQFAAVKDMRNKYLKLRAVYHSHPETPARPSREDISLAYDPDVSYVIISFAKPESEIKSFLIQNQQVEHEEIEVV